MDTRFGGKAAQIGGVPETAAAATPDFAAAIAHDDSSTRPHRAHAARGRVRRALKSRDFYAVSTEVFGLV